MESFVPLVNENQQGESHDLGGSLRKPQLESLKQGVQAHCEDEHYGLNHGDILVYLQVMMVVVVVMIMVAVLLVLFLVRMRVRIRMRMRMGVFETLLFLFLFLFFFLMRGAAAFSLDNLVSESHSQFLLSLDNCQIVLLCYWL